VHWVAGIDCKIEIANKARASAFLIFPHMVGLAASLETTLFLGRPKWARLGAALSACADQVRVGSVKTKNSFYYKNSNRERYGMRID